MSIPDLRAHILNGMRLGALLVGFHVLTLVVHETGFAHRPVDWPAELASDAELFVLLVMGGAFHSALLPRFRGRGLRGPNGAGALAGALAAVTVLVGRMARHVATGSARPPALLVVLLVLLGAAAGVVLAYTGRRLTGALSR